MNEDEFKIIENKEIYKEIFIQDTSFSVRVRNSVCRGKIFTLYDLIEVYNRGEIMSLKNFGKKCVDEILEHDYDQEVENLKVRKYLDKEFPDEGPQPIELGEDILSKSISDYVLDNSYLDILNNNGINTVRDFLSINETAMFLWPKTGKKKVECFIELRKHLFSNDDYILINGEVRSRSEKIRTREIDHVVLEDLKQRFGFSPSDLARCLHKSKQSIDNNIAKAKRRGGFDWTGFDLTEEDRTLFWEMLKNRTPYINEDTYFCCFLKDYKGDYAFLVGREAYICCYYLKDLPDDLQQFITTDHNCIFDEEEDEIIASGKTYYVLKKEYFSSPKGTLISKYVRKRDMSKEDYIKFLTGKDLGGIHYIEDDEIIAFFEKNLTEDGKVYISSDPINQWIKSYASRNNFLISDFIRFYGYEPALSADGLTMDGARRRHIEALKRYVIKDNIVYIPSSSQCYKVINTYAQKNKYGLANYIEELGFIRSLTPSLSSTLVNPDESDMEPYSCEEGGLKGIFSSNPLIGNHIFSPKQMDRIHVRAQILIDNFAFSNKSIDSEEDQRVLAFSVINYAKKWEPKDCNFTKYLCMQYGYKESLKIYEFLKMNTCEIIRKEKRWEFTSETGLEYKSTILIHAMGPISSWMYLCDFLSDIYFYNLGGKYIEEDPAILNAVYLTREKMCAPLMAPKSEGEEAFRIGSSIYQLQEGIRKLIIYRPNYTAKVFDRMIKRIHCMMTHSSTDIKTYEDYIVNFWFEQKRNYFLQLENSTKKSAPKDKHTGDVLFDYSKFRPEYVFEDGEIYLDIPDIRLMTPTFEPCFMDFIYKGRVKSESLKCYGNELGRTIVGKRVPIKDFLFHDDEIQIQIKIRVGDRIICDSENRLFRYELCFHNKHERTISQKGDYILVVAAGSAITGDNINVKVISSTEKYVCYLVELSDDYIVFINDSIFASDKNTIEKVRISLPVFDKLAHYIEEGQEYSICKAGEAISILMDEEDIEQKYLIYLNDEIIPLSSLESNSCGDGMVRYTINTKGLNGKNNKLCIVDFSSKRLLFYKRFIVVNDFLYRYNQPFYYLTSEIKKASLEYSIDGEEGEVINVGNGDTLRIDYLDGELAFLLPIIRIKDSDDQVWKRNNYYIDSINRGLYLKTVSNQDSLNVTCSLNIDGRELQPDINGFYSIGGIAHSILDKDKVKITAVMSKGDFQQEYLLARIFYSESFVTKPILNYENGIITWNKGGGFIGKNDSNVKLIIKNKDDNEIYNNSVILENEIICESISLDEGEYTYSFVVEMDDFFDVETKVLAEGTLYSGDEDLLRFIDYRIHLTDMLFENENKVVRIKDVYIDSIEYDEAASKVECSEGIRPIYHGVMYFIKDNGERHDFSFEDVEKYPNDFREKVNPVRIVYINDHILLVTMPDESGLMARFYIDKFKRTKEYFITDHVENEHNKGAYSSVDLLRYKKERY